MRCKPSCCAYVYVATLLTIVCFTAAEVGATSSIATFSAKVVVDPERVPANSSTTVVEIALREFQSALSFALGLPSLGNVSVTIESHVIALVNTSAASEASLLQRLDDLAQCTAVANATTKQTDDSAVLCGLFVTFSFDGTNRASGADRLLQLSVSRWLEANMEYVMFGSLQLPATQAPATTATAVTPAPSTIVSLPPGYMLSLSAILAPRATTSAFLAATAAALSISLAHIRVLSVRTVLFEQPTGLALLLSGAHAMGTQSAAQTTEVNFTFTAGDESGQLTNRLLQTPVETILVQRLATTFVAVPSSAPEPTNADAADSGNSEEQRVATMKTRLVSVGVPVAAGGCAALIALCCGMRYCSERCNRHKQISTCIQPSPVLPPPVALGHVRVMTPSAPAVPPGPEFNQQSTLQSAARRALMTYDRHAFNNNTL